MDRRRMLVLPPSVDDLLPQIHLARFVVDAVDRLDLDPILARYDARARGSPPHHPAMMLAPLLRRASRLMPLGWGMKLLCGRPMAYFFVARCITFLARCSAASSASLTVARPR